MIVKTGMEDRRKIGLACGLIAIAAVLTIRWVDSGFVEKAEMNGNGVLHPSAGSRALASKTWVDPMLNTGALRATEAARYEGSGRDIFHVALDLPPRRKTEKWEPEKTVTIRHEETVTPFPLTFFGFSRRGDARSIFLLAGEDVFIAREGDVVDRRYRIVRVTPESVEVEDVMKQETEKLWLKDG
jgi:hypothetical protein